MSHRYFPHTPAEEAEMLASIGVKNTDSLFSSIPETCRRDRPIDLPMLSEWDLLDHAETLSEKMPSGASSWVGAGSYYHYIPAVVPYLMSRSEFSTAYTPYQPEISQGTLQGIFEYQTLMSRILEMDVVNASMYDGATALAEGALMASRIKKSHTVLVSEGIHPNYIQVLKTYCSAADISIVMLPLDHSGSTDIAAMKKALAENEPAGVLVQSPNFYGVIENCAEQSECVHAAKSLFVLSFTEVMAYGLLKSPGSFGADIVCGEGQSFGLPQSFGGPYLGIMATRREYMRNIPGRLVGQTADSNGKRAFVLTLATREQHIRREKAVSNICSNSGLCAMTCAAFLASLGGTGLSRMAQLNRDKAAYLKTGLEKLGFVPCYSGSVFNEFAMIAPPEFEKKHTALQKKGILFGLPLKEKKNAYLFCVTERRSAVEMDTLLKEAANV